MTRLGLRAKLLIGMFVILCVSIGLVAGQAVLLFQEDKSSYVFDLNASQAIKIADEIQTNARHLTEKMRILFDAVRLPVPAGPDRTAVLVSILRRCRHPHMRSQFRSATRCPGSVRSTDAPVLACSTPRARSYPVTAPYCARYFAI